MKHRIPKFAYLQDLWPDNQATNRLNKVVYPLPPSHLIWVKAWLGLAVLLSVGVFGATLWQSLTMSPPKDCCHAPQLAQPLSKQPTLLTWWRYPSARIALEVDLMSPPSTKSSVTLAKNPIQSLRQISNTPAQPTITAQSQSSQVYPTKRWRLSIVPTMISPAVLQQCWQRALAYEQSGELEMARLAYEDVLRMDNQHIDSLQALARLAKTRGDVAGAQAYQARIEALFPLSLSDNAWE